MIVYIIKTAQNKASIMNSSVGLLLQPQDVEGRWDEERTRGGEEERRRVGEGRRRGGEEERNRREEERWRRGEEERTKGGRE